MVGKDNEHDSNRVGKNLLFAQFVTHSGKMLTLIGYCDRFVEGHEGVEVVNE